MQKTSTLSFTLDVKFWLAGQQSHRSQFSSTDNEDIFPPIRQWTESIPECAGKRKNLKKYYQNITRA